MFLVVSMSNYRRLINMDIKKLRRRIEDLLRKSEDAVIIKIAKILGVKHD